MAKKRYHNSRGPHSPVAPVVSAMRGREAYSGHDESRKMMAHDGSMIKEDMSAPCLLPRNVIDREFPKANNYAMGFVEDLYYGAEKQMHEDYADLKRELDPAKY